METVDASQLSTECSSMAGSSLAVTWDKMNLSTWHELQESGEGREGERRAKVWKGSDVYLRYLGPCRRSYLPIDKLQLTRYAQLLTGAL